MTDVTPVPSSKPRKRCAVYCRVSSDERLEREFNSIDAQKEAGGAYVASQRPEGWIAVADDYDDPGFSGGNTERPALKRLMADIDRGLVDIVVVYKIDRLTRSLADFSKMVEVFERRGVSFVSVTQQFNTTTSMGRLTINVLLSFAQFEREVISRLGSCLPVATSRNDDILALRPHVSQGGGHFGCRKATAPKFCAAFRVEGAKVAIDRGADEDEPAGAAQSVRQIWRALAQGAAERHE